MRATTPWRTATPEAFKLFGTTHVPPKRTGFGRLNKLRSRPGDNVAWYDKGPVEWLPRPVRLTYDHLDQLRAWMMRATLDEQHDAFNTIRQLHRDWSQHPLMPVLGDVEPRFPLNLYKQNHRAKTRFLTRWHKANSPGHWLWAPRGSIVATPLHRRTASEFPECWRQMARAGLSSSSSQQQQQQPQLPPPLAAAAASSSSSSASARAEADAATSSTST